MVYLDFQATVLGEHDKTEYLHRDCQEAERETVGACWLCSPHSGLVLPASLILSGKTLRSTTRGVPLRSLCLYQSSQLRLRSPENRRKEVEVENSVQT